MHEVDHRARRVLARVAGGVIGTCHIRRKNALHSMKPPATMSNPGTSIIIPNGWNIAYMMRGT
jgi:hypothetical protein